MTIAPSLLALNFSSTSFEWSAQGNLPVNDKVFVFLLEASMCPTVEQSEAGGVGTVVTLKQIAGNTQHVRQHPQREKQG